MVDTAEIARVVNDLTWLEDCTCSQRPLEDFFVPAGHVPPKEAMDASRNCPTRRQEVIFAYGRDIRAGYIGGLSAGQRQKMTLEQALAFIATDTPRPARRR